MRKIIFDRCGKEIEESETRPFHEYEDTCKDCRRKLIRIYGPPLVYWKYFKFEEKLAENYRKASNEQRSKLLYELAKARQNKDISLIENCYEQLQLCGISYHMASEITKPSSLTIFSQ